MSRKAGVLEKLSPRVQQEVSQSKSGHYDKKAQFVEYRFPSWCKAAVAPGGTRNLCCWDVGNDSGIAPGRPRTRF